MAEAAERPLEGTGWLPAPLRTPGSPRPGAASGWPPRKGRRGRIAGCRWALPAFLVQDDADATEALAPYLTAAE